MLWGWGFSSYSTSLRDDEVRDLQNKIQYLSTLSEQKLKQTLEENPQIVKPLSDIKIPVLEVELGGAFAIRDPREGKDRGQYQEEFFSRRRSIQNEGNTCYLNSALQALRNSLNYSTTDLGVFARRLKGFYEGNESIVSYLEQSLGTNLRKQSDASEYFTKICQLLEKEGSEQILDKIKIRDNIVVWKCKKCGTISKDTRGSRVIAFSLLLTDMNSTLKKILDKALTYERERNCKTCDHERMHSAHKTFNVEHLVLVASDPYALNLRPHLDFDLHDLHYELISTVLHSGSTYGGHYIATVKDYNGTWSVCNDSSVTTIPTKQLESYLSGWVTTQMIYKVTKHSNQYNEERYPHYEQPKVSEETNTPNVSDETNPDIEINTYDKQKNQRKGKKSPSETQLERVEEKNISPDENQSSEKEDPIVAEEKPNIHEKYHTDVKAPNVSDIPDVEMTSTDNQPPYS